MNCANCNSPLPADAAFCPNCGQKPGAPTRAAGGGVKTFSGLGTIAPIHESEGTALEPGAMFADRYQIIRKIGEGGMGIVYVAKDTNSGQELVLKLIHPRLVTGEEAVKRLMAEGLTTRELRHPNIVAVYDVTHWKGQPYFTMEYVKGGTLRSWLVNGIASGREVSLDAAVGIIRTMLNGLSEAHRKRLIHRDLKPENVLLVGDPDAGNYDLKILDFGIAHAVDAPRQPGRSTNGFGSEGYMAPEQKTSADAVGPEADLYALAVMLYELLMGALPFPRWEMVSKNRPGVPKAVDEFLERASSSRPKSRYPSVEAFTAAMDAAVAQGAAPVPDPIKPEPVRPEPVRPEPVKPEPKKWGVWNWASMSKTQKIWTSVAGVVVVLGLIGSFQDPQPPSQPDSDSDGVIDVMDACPSVFGTLENGCPPQQVPPPVPPEVNSRGRSASTGLPSLSGRWKDDFGNVFTVTHDGADFEGVANNVVASGIRYGRVTIDGTLTTLGGEITMEAQDGRVLLSGRGQLNPSPNVPGAFDATFNGATFHINH